MKKRLLFGLTALTCALTMTGCGGDDKGKPLSAEEKNTAYGNLRTVASQPLYDLEKTSGSQLTVSMDTSVKGDLDFSKSGLNSTEINEIKENSLLYGLIDLDRISMGVKSVVGYKPDGSGYEKLYTKMFGFSGLISQEVTKKVGNDYLNYFYQDVMGEEKTVSKVDENYAKNTYASMETFSGGEMEMNEDLVNVFDELIDSINENETFDGFKLDATDLSKLLLESGSENEYMDSEYDLSEVSANAVVDITLTDGVYELKVEMDIDDFKMNNEMGNSESDMESEISIKFDKNSIKSVMVDMDIDSETTMKTSDFSDKAGLTDENTLTQEMELGVKVEFAPGEFDNQMLAQDFSGYTGTGENSEIENKQVDVEFVCVNADSYSTGDFDFYSFAYGQNIKTIFDSYVEEESFDFSNFKTVKLYWDEDCQNEITENDILQSSDTTIYFKLEAKTGTAFVDISTIYQYGNGATSTTYHDDFYEAGSELTFADFIDEGETITLVIVNGQVVTTPVITLEDGVVYQIEVYCE